MFKFYFKQQILNTNLFKLSNLVKNKNFCSYSNIPISEPEEFRSIYVENLPLEWTDEDIRIRLEQIGIIEKLHIIKNSLGEHTGKVFAVYNRIDHISQAIKIFKDKLPFMKPVKIRFYREFKIKNKRIENAKSSVLLIKNIPNELLKEDLNLFLSEFKEPIHIAYPRDEENEFKNIAYVYFNSVEDADFVLKFANLRYVKNKQLYIQFSNNHYDISDFRTRIEFDVKLPLVLEMKYFQKQIEFYKSLKNKSESNKDKIEYLQMRYRKLEYRLKQDYKEIEAEKEKSPIASGSNAKKRIYSYNDDKSMILVNKDNKYI